MNPRLRIATSLDEIAPGDIFLPAAGKEGDRHHLIPDALARGATGYYFEPGRFDPATTPGVEARATPSLRELLFSLARERRAGLTARVAVIAGSNGKTSTKELLGAMLRAAHGARAFVSPANLNTKVALASQILKLPDECRVAAFEVGARRPGDFDVPLSFLRPEAVALLNIGTAHRGEFGGEAAQVATKLSVLASPGVRTLVVPAGDERIVARARQVSARVLRFGEEPTAEFRGIPRGRTLELHAEGERHELPVSDAPAAALNLTAAVALARALDVPWPTIHAGAAAEGVHASPGRFERYEWRGRMVVDDAFNAAPESARAGIARFLELYGAEGSVLVLGSMLELGLESERMHRELGRWLRGKVLRLFTVGEEARVVGDEARTPEWKHFASAEEARRALVSSDWDAVYLKGSRAIGLLGVLKENRNV